MQATMYDLPFRLPKKLIPALVKFISLRANMFRTDQVSHAGMTGYENLRGKKVPGELFDLGLGKYVKVLDKTREKSDRTHTRTCISLYPALNRNNTYKIINRTHYEVRPMPNGAIKMLEHLDDDKYGMQARERGPLVQPSSAALNIKTNHTPMEDDAPQRSKKRNMIAVDDDDYEEGNKRLRSYATLVYFATMTMVEGMKKHRNKAMESVYDELAQLHKRSSWKAVFSDGLIEEDWKDIIPSHMLLAEKFTPESIFERLKARLVANGQYEHWLMKEDTTSDAVHRNSLFAMSATAAHHDEGEEVYVIDFLGSYPFAEIPKEMKRVLMCVSKPLTDILCEIDPFYQAFRTAKGFIIVELLKVVYECKFSGKLWYYKIKRVLEEYGFTNGTKDYALRHGVGKRSRLILSRSSVRVVHRWSWLPYNE